MDIEDLCVFLSECNLVGNPKEWWIDSAATRHVEVTIGRAGPGQQWVGPKPGRAKIGPVFSGQNFNSPVRPKNRASRAK